jgi:hypothetical protein
MKQKVGSWVNKIDKPLGNLTRRRRKTIQINKIRDEKSRYYNKYQ